MTPLISAQLVVRGSAGSVMDSSPLPRLARRLLDLDGLSGVTLVGAWHV
jgi:hypothetical protein